MYLLCSSPLEMRFFVGEVMENFYAILREFTELYKNIGEIKRKEMSSNIDIKL